MQRPIEFRVWNGKHNVMLYYPNFVYLIDTKTGSIGGNELLYLQYTGKDDCDKIKIFEGDIIESTWRENWIENGGYPHDKWQERKHVFVIDYRANGFTFESTDFSRAAIIDIRLKVIGNIYQHPQLIPTR